MGTKPSWRVVGSFGLANILLLYVWCSAFIKEAVYLAPMGLAAVVASGALARRGRPRALFAVTMGFAMAATCVLALESVLWIAPGVLRGDLANAAYSKYHAWNGGMYLRDRHRCYRMKPNYRVDTYWAGHWWTHDANSAGYRGKRLDRADAVFLGDSMIYGHGVETEETVAAHFERATGLASANLGQQGTCLLQALNVFEEKGVALHPRMVFVCGHPNDADEAAIWYPEHELRRFLAMSTTERFDIEGRRNFHPKPWWQLDYAWQDRWKIPLRTAGAARWLIREAPIRVSRMVRDEPPLTPPVWQRVPYLPDQSYETSSSREFGWAVNMKALAHLQARCESIGAELIALDIGIPTEFSMKFEASVKRLGVRYSDAGRVALDRCLEGEEIYLENDGHWTVRGSEVVAEALARDVGTSPGRPGPPMATGSEHRAPVKR